MRDLWAAVTLAALLKGSLFAQTICPPHSRWQGSFGAGNSDHGSRIVQLADGGFVIGGSSYDSSQSTQGNKTAPSYGWDDFYLVRIDAQGQKLWDRTYGGPYFEDLAALEQTSDGGFLLAGTFYNGLSSDFWIVRTDADGNKLWDRSFNGAGDDHLSAAKQTADGGFILGGSSRGSGLAQPNFWIIRIDGSGNKLWDATFGGDRDDSLSDIELASDGGFFLGGRSLSDVSGSRTAPSYGNHDYWLVRVDANGTKIWDRAYGGSGADYLESLASAPNGDLFLAGESWSGINGNKTVDNFGANDFWTLRVDVDGNIVWQSISGGASLEYFRSATAAGTNGVILCGESYSTPSGSKTSHAFRNADAWIVRIDAGGNQIWDASFGTSGFDAAGQVIPTADGGYAMIGSSDFVNGNKTSPHFGGADMWVVKLDPENPDDCDNDGVPNALDLCGDTPFGSIVNSNGCAVTQICPCQGWPEHADYVACVERVSAEFENAGLITSAGRAAMVADAQAANCPPSVVIFGLVHVLARDTIVRGGAEQGYVEFTPGTNYPWGASVLLGEADSGIFIDPDAGGWGSYDDGWFLDGTAHGRFQDGSNGLIVTVHATKPDLETYPVDVDFSPLGPSSITIQQINPATGIVTDEENLMGPLAASRFIPPPTSIRGSILFGECPTGVSALCSSSTRTVTTALARYSFARTTQAEGCIT